jgi:hypothetical protein
VREVDLKKPLAQIHGRYLLEDRIEAGELGSLWWARDGSSGRQCVVCLVDIPRTGTNDRIPCSGREAMAFAQGECGRLVSMVEHGEWEGMTFFVLALPNDGQDASDPSRETRIRATLPSESPQWGERGGPGPESDVQVLFEGAPTRAGLPDDPPSTCRPVVAGPESLQGEDDDEPSSEIGIVPPRRRYASKIAAVSLGLAAVAVLLMTRLWHEDPVATQTPEELGQASGKMVSAALPAASTLPWGSARPATGSLLAPPTRAAQNPGRERVLVWSQSAPGRAGQPSDATKRRAGAPGTGMDLPKNLATLRTSPAPIGSQQSATRRPWSGRLAPAPSSRVVVVEEPDYGI